MSHDRGCPCGREFKSEYLECPEEGCLRRTEKVIKQDLEIGGETPEDDFDYVLDQVKSLSKSDQKDVAEDILKRFNEDGWQIVWDDYSLSLSKTEYL